MLKKGLLFIVVLVGMIGLNTGFFNKHVDMKFIQKPEMLQIASNLHEKEITEMVKKMEELQTKQGTEAEQMILNQQIQTIYTNDIVITADKDILGLVYDGLNSTNAILGALSNGMKKSKAVVDNGIIMPPKEGIYFKIYFQYSSGLSQNSNEEIIESIKNGYIPYIFIFPNNLAYVPVYDEAQSTKISTVKVRIDEDTMDKFEKYYHDNRKK